MRYDLAIKGWMQVDADNEEEAKVKVQEAIEWLTEESHKHGYTEGTFFEEVGLMPLADPPAFEAE